MLPGARVWATVQVAEKASSASKTVFFMMYISKWGFGIGSVVTFCVQ